MLKRLLLGFFVLSMVVVIPSCKSGKVPCPTYADSFPEKKKKKKPEPEIPKSSKAKSSVMPGGTRSHHVQ